MHMDRELLVDDRTVGELTNTGLTNSYDATYATMRLDGFSFHLCTASLFWLQFSLLMKVSARPRSEVAFVTDDNFKHSHGNEKFLESW